MGLSQIFAVLRRRWPYFVLGLLLSLGLGYGALLIEPPVYVAKGSVLLLPSEEQLDAGGRNPFLHLDALTAPASIVIARLSGTQAQDEIKAISPKAEFVVEPDPAMRGPGILATVTDDSPKSALSTLDVVLQKISDTLDQVQADRKVPRTAIVGSMRLVVDSKAERDISGTLRAVVAVVVAGLAVTAALVYSLDGLALRRRLRASVKAVPTEEQVAAEDEGAVRVEEPTLAARKARSRRKTARPAVRATVEDGPEQDVEEQDVEVAPGDGNSAEASSTALAGRSSRRAR